MLPIKITGPLAAREPWEGKERRKKEKKRKKKEEKEEKERANVTHDSRLVTHGSTKRAQTRLTSVIGREPVHSRWYERWQYSHVSYSSIKHTRARGLAHGVRWGER